VYNNMHKVLGIFTVIAQATQLHHDICLEAYCGGDARCTWCWHAAEISQSCAQDQLVLHCIALFCLNTQIATNDK